MTPSDQGTTMEHKYTATVYTNSHITSSHVGNDLSQLTTTLLIHLDDSNSGSYGTITDDYGTIVQQFCKRADD